MKEVKADIKQRSFRPCYLFFGPEDYLRKAYAEQLKNALVDETAAMMNFDSFEGKQPVAPIFAAAETLPFLAEKRAVFVVDSELFQPGRQKDSEEMLAYLPQIPESTCLVFVEQAVDKRSKLYKALAKAGRAVECKTPSEKELVNWAARRVQAAGRQIDSRTVMHLLSTVGTDMHTLSMELDKLTAYPGSGADIRAEDIDAVCTKSLETKIFDMVDALGRKEPEKALRIYRNLLMLKEPAIKILAMVIRQFRLLYQCKYLLGQGETKAGVVARMGVSEFVVRKTMAQAENFNLETLGRALEDCLAADIGFKTGKINDDLAVELLLIRYGS